MDYSAYLGIPLNTHAGGKEAHYASFNTGKKVTNLRQPMAKESQPLQQISSIRNVRENRTKMLVEPYRKRRLSTGTGSNSVSMLITSIERSNKENNHCSVTSDHHGNRIQKETDENNNKNRFLQFSSSPLDAECDPFDNMTDALNQKSSKPTKQVLKASLAPQERVCKDIDKFICGECNKSFVSVNDMNMHIDTCKNIKGMIKLKLKLKEKAI